MSRRCNRRASRALGWWSAIGSALVVVVARPSSLHAQGVVMLNGVPTEQTETKHDGFSVRKEASKFNDALDDFVRYRDKKAWELAFRSLETLAEAKRDGMVPAGNGFYVPSRQRIFMSLTSLPPEGKQAFRLFYDAKAKQLLDRVESASKESTGTPVVAVDGKAMDEISSLREIFDRYFISSVGDKATDRLGDALFESGDFAGAAAAWGAILKDAPDTTIPRLRLSVKRATALARAGQWDIFEQALRGIRSEFAGEKLSIGGQDQIAVDYLESIRDAAKASTKAVATTAPTTGPTTAPLTEIPEPTGPFELPREDKPVWQVKILDDSLGKKLQQAFVANSWAAQMSTLRQAIPAAASDGNRIYANWLGIVFAVDAKTGKLLWRNRKFSELGDKFQNFLNMMMDTDSYTLTRAGSSLLVTGINLDRINNYQEPVRLVCMNAADGKVKWSSTSGALSTWSFVGTPTAIGEVVYIAARQRQAMDVSLLAIGSEKGELLWQVLLGTAQGGTNYRGETDMPMPLLVSSGAGSLYVVTNNGALVAVDTVARRLQWAYNYESPPVQNRQMFWNGEQTQSRPKMPAAAFVDGSTLCFKEEGGSAVYAVNLDGPSLLWKRPLDRESSIAPLASGQLLSIGQDVAAIDAKSDRRAMLWSAPLPQLIGRIEPIVSGQHVLAFVPRGVYELNSKNGDTVRIFRGADRDSIGGTLRRVPGRLISVSNLAITAYPVSDAAPQAAN